LSDTSFVLRALKILGLEDMQKLSAVLHVKQVPLKKAAGGELIVWDETEEKPAKPAHRQEEAKILNFPKKTITDLAPMPEEANATEEGEPVSLIHSDVVLWQREISRQSGEVVQKQDAFKGYQKSTEMYVVKTPTPEGKDRIRFAATNGILVNKKQA
jgi:hypothetical protein